MFIENFNYQQFIDSLQIETGEEYKKIKAYIPVIDTRAEIINGVVVGIDNTTGQNFNFGKLCVNPYISRAGFIDLHGFDVEVHFEDTFNEPTLPLDYSKVGSFFKNTKTNPYFLLNDRDYIVNCVPNMWEIIEVTKSLIQENYPQLSTACTNEINEKDIKDYYELIENSLYEHPNKRVLDFNRVNKKLNKNPFFPDMIELLKYRAKGVDQIQKNSRQSQLMSIVLSSLDPEYKAPSLEDDITKIFEEKLNRFSKGLDTNNILENVNDFSDLINSALIASSQRVYELLQIPIN